MDVVQLYFNNKLRCFIVFLNIRTCLHGFDSAISYFPFTSGPFNLLPFYSLLLLSPLFAFTSRLFSFILSSLLFSSFLSSPLQFSPSPLCLLFSYLSLLFPSLAFPLFFYHLFHVLNDPKLPRTCPDSCIRWKSNISVLLLFIKSIMHSVRVPIGNLHSFSIFLMYDI